MSQALCKKQTLIRYSFCNPSYQHKLLCMVKMGLSIPHSALSFFLLKDIITYHWFYMFGVQATCSQKLIVHASPRFSPYSVYACLTLLSTWVLVSLMYQTVSNEVEKFPGLTIVINNSRYRIWETLGSWYILGENTRENTEFPEKFVTNM